MMGVLVSHRSSEREVRIRVCAGASNTLPSGCHKYMAEDESGKVLAQVYTKETSGDFVILFIEVLPSLRNKGIGKNILWRMAQEAHGRRILAKYDDQHFNRTSTEAFLYRVGFTSPTPDCCTLTLDIEVARQLLVAWRRVCTLRDCHLTKLSKIKDDRFRDVVSGEGGIPHYLNPLCLRVAYDEKLYIAMETTDDIVGWMFGCGRQRDIHIHGLYIRPAFRKFKAGIALMCLFLNEYLVQDKSYSSYDVITFNFDGEDRRLSDFYHRLFAEAILAEAKRYTMTYME